MNMLTSFYLHFFVVIEKEIVQKNALVSLIEKWKDQLDKKAFAGDVLMDLSRASDAVNYELSIAKLNHNLGGGVLLPPLLV